MTGCHVDKALTLMNSHSTYPLERTPSFEARAKRRAQTHKGHTKGKGKGKDKRRTSPESSPTYTVCMVPMWSMCIDGAAVTPPRNDTPLSSIFHGLYNAGGDLSCMPEWAPGDCTPDTPECINNTGNPWNNRSQAAVPTRGQVISRRDRLRIGKIYNKTIPRVADTTAPRSCDPLSDCTSLGEAQQSSCTETANDEAPNVHELSVKPIQAGNTAPGANIVTSTSQDEVAYLCVICWEKPCDTAVVPCGHMCGCYHCLKQIYQKVPHACPICTEPMVSILTVFQAGVQA